MRDLTGGELLQIGGGSKKNKGCGKGGKGGGGYGDFGKSKGHSGFEQGCPISGSGKGGKGSKSKKNKYKDLVMCETPEVVEQIEEPCDPIYDPVDGAEIEGSVEAPAPDVQPEEEAVDQTPDYSCLPDAGVCDVVVTVEVTITLIGYCNDNSYTTDCEPVTVDEPNVVEDFCFPFGVAA